MPGTLHLHIFHHPAATTRMLKNRACLSIASQSMAIYRRNEITTIHNENITEILISVLCHLTFTFSYLALADNFSFFVQTAYRMYQATVSCNALQLSFW